MASAPPLRDSTPLTGGGTDPRGMTVRDILKMTPHEALMATLAVSGADEALVSGQPMMRPAEQVRFAAEQGWGAGSDAAALAGPEAVAASASPSEVGLTLGQLMGGGTP